MFRQYNITGYISYVNGVLCVNGIPYTKIISKDSSPTICVSLDRVRSNINIFQNNIQKTKGKVFYAIKACYDRRIVDTVLGTGIGAEVISEYEWLLAIRAGFSPDNIIMNGLGRTDDELMEALISGAIVNIDSLSELNKLELHKEQLSALDVKIGLRINPQFDGEGNFVKRYGKLGMSYKETIECIQLSQKIGLQVQGFSFHIFSNQIEYLSYDKPIRSFIKFIKEMEKRFSIDCSYVDLGGGIAPRMFFRDDYAFGEFVGHIISLFKSGGMEKSHIFFEPGRYIVADATIVFARIKTIKRNPGGIWAVLDIGTNYLIPAPGSNYRVIPCKKDNVLSANERVHFVDGICSPAGHICEASFNVTEGQYVAVLNSGAYTSVMREEFVYGTPRYVYLEKESFADVIDKVSLGQFLSYHGWNEKRPN